MAFGKYIRREREGRDMTLTELARRVEVSIADLSQIERERMIFSPLQVQCAERSDRDGQTLPRRLDAIPTARPSNARRERCGQR